LRRSGSSPSRVRSPRPRRRTALTAKRSRAPAGPASPRRRFPIRSCASSPDAGGRLPATPTLGRRTASSRSDSRPASSSARDISFAPICRTNNHAAGSRTSSARPLATGSASTTDVAQNRWERAAAAALFAFG
jgi:hypothetical protein